MGELAELRRRTGMTVCQQCGKCTTMCPLAAAGGFSARMIACQDSEEGVQACAVAVERCLTCASCEVRCPQGVRFAEFVRGARQLLPPATRWPCPHGQVLDSAARLMADSPPAARKADWLGDELRVAEQGETALLVGCLPLFNVVFQKQLGLDLMEIVRAAVRLLNRLDIEPVVVADECCCGHDLLWSGDTETFAALAKANARAFADRGVRHVLTACAECCRTWRSDYPEVVPEYQPRVEHLSEFLAKQLEGGKLAFQGNGAGKVTYQDPCRLGRHLGVYDAPRRLLAAASGAGLVEMQRTGRDAVCCGTAGFVHCDAVSRRLQQERLASAAQTGATKLLTACPKCLIHFTCAQAEDRRTGRDGPPLEVEDLTVFAAKAMVS